MGSKDSAYIEKSFPQKTRRTERDVSQRPRGFSPYRRYAVVKLRRSGLTLLNKVRPVLRQTFCGTLKTAALTVLLKPIVIVVKRYERSGIRHRFPLYLIGENLDLLADGWLRVRCVAPPVQLCTVFLSIGTMSCSKWNLHDFLPLCTNVAVYSNCPFQ